MHLSIDPSSGEKLRLSSSASRAEQFSLWALRWWWCAFPDLQAGWREFLHGFRVCGVSSAVEPCHRFCMIMLSAGGCGSGPACLNYPHILPTEEQMLAALARGATGETWVVEASLRTFAPAAAARSAASLAVDYAQYLASAGLNWPGAQTSRTILRAYDDTCIGSGRVH